jgi:ABC-type cobalamin/Fe3+-siderophores transport system ATPase subunit
MRESADSFMYTIWRLFDSSDESLNDRLRFIQDYYSLVEMKNVVVDGYLPYPAATSIDLGLEGMKIEFRDVSMKYPKSTSYALKNVSFTIPAGATVILVGANGSGKTTTVSLLSRLMDATSGEILIDDVPLKQYQVQTIRDAQAVLRQSYQHFPFSIKENIGMGDPNWLSDECGTEKEREEKIMRAARLGGADEIIEEIRGLSDKRLKVFEDATINGTKGGHQHLFDVSHHGSANPSRVNLSASDTNGDMKDSKDSDKSASKDAVKKVNGGANAVSEAGIEESKESGWDINVAPVRTWEGSWHIGGSKLGEMSEEVEKSIELSGGQWQRMALARLFMRAEGERIRLICTDEPSAALDPRAEFGKCTFFAIVE